MSKRTVHDTSKAAFDSIKGEMQDNHYGKILAAFDILVWANYEQIAAKIGMERHQVGRRLGELELSGKIYKTAMKIPTSTGRQAYAYAKTGAGIPKAEIKKKQAPLPPNIVPVRAHTRNLKKEDTVPNHQQHLF